MAIDFTNPQIADQFRQRAMSSGRSIDEIEDYITKRTRQQETSIYGSGELGKARLKLAAEGLKEDKVETTQEKVSGLGDFEKKIFNARVAGKEALTELQKGENVSGPIATRVQKIGEAFGKPTKGTVYRAKLATAASQLFNALAGTAQSDAELKRLEKMIPRDTDSEEVAMVKLQTMLDLLEKQSSYYGIPSLEEDDSFPSMGEEMPGLGSSPTLSISAMDQKIEEEKDLQPRLNLSGELAEPGDLIRGDDGGLQIFGEATESNIRKAGKSEVDNKLIKYLAESNFLPIAGSITGGIMGSGVASVGTGAAGAMVGKAGQQYFKELLDPDAQDLSDHARVILTEGMVDALFSGLTFGVLKGGKLIFKKTGSTIAKEGVEEVSEQAMKGLSESSLAKAKNIGKEYAESGLSKKAYNQSKKALQEYARKSIGVSKLSAFKKTWGVDWADYMLANVDELPKNTDDLARLARSTFSKASTDLTEILGRTSADPDEFISILNSTINNEAYLSPSGEKIFLSVDEKGVAALKDLMEDAKKFKAKGMDVPGEAINSFKKQMQRSFAGKPDISKKVTRKAATTTKEWIEKLPSSTKDQLRVKGANYEKAWAYLAEDIADKASTKEGSAALVSFTDALLFLKPKALLSKNIVEMFGGLNSLQRASLFKKSADILLNKASKEGGKEATKGTMRALLLLAQKTGITFDVSDELIKSVSRGAAIGEKALRPEQGLGEIPQLQESTPSPGVSLGAMSPEGAPLYK